MHILIFHQYFLDKNQGGGARFNQFSKYWIEADHHITVISGMVDYITGCKPEKWKGKFIVEENTGNLKVIRTHVSEQYNKSFLGRLWGYFSFTFSSVFALITLKSYPDVIIATSPPLFIGIPGIIAKMKYRVPFVFEVRDLWPETAVETGVLQNRMLIRLSTWLEQYIYKKADAINVLTPAFQESLVNKGIPESKIWFIPNGADLDLFKEEDVRDNVRLTYGWGNKFIILYTGAHGIANSLDQLIYAAEKLERDLPEALFVLVGDGMEKPGLIKMAKEKRLSNVCFMPSQPKERIKDFVYACDVGIAVLKNIKVFKTVYPNKVFDYMACSKPIIIGIGGVAKDLVTKHAQCGVYCEPENADEIVKAVKTYYYNTELRAQHGKNGSAFVKDNFERKKLAAKYLVKLKGLFESSN